MLPSGLDAQFGTPYPRSAGFDTDRRVVQGVLKHKKFKATPSFVRHTVLVKLTQEDDVACLHKQVYQWQGHKVVFMKVHRIELLRDVLDDVHGKVRLVSIQN